jgi:hypothetical protein
MNAVQIVDDCNIDGAVPPAVKIVALERRRKIFCADLNCSNIGTQRLTLCASPSSLESGTSTIGAKRLQI